MTSHDLNSDEHEVLQQVARGDSGAFHELVNNYAHLLFTFVFRIVDNRPIAEELVQDTFVKIWLNRERLMEIQNFRAYLFTISKNFALKAVQKALREKEVLAEWQSFNREDAHHMLKEARLLLIEEAIEQLPPQQRKVWTMSRRQRMTYMDIADELGLSRESVKKYLQFAHASILRYVKGKINLTLFVALFI